MLINKQHVPSSRPPVFNRSRLTRAICLIALVSGCDYQMGDKVSLEPLQPDNFLELYDSVDNYDLMVRRSGSIIRENGGDNYNARFDGDATRLKRILNTEETLIYSVEGDISSFELTTFFHQSETDIADFNVQISNNGVDFSDIQVEKTSTETADSWVKVVYSAENIISADYIRFVFPKALQDSNVWHPQVGDVRIQYVEQSSLSADNQLPLKDPQPIAGGSAPKVVPGSISNQSQFDYYITRQGNTLYDGDNEFRFLSFNVPELHTQESPYWGVIDPFEQEDAIKTIVSTGGKVARTYVLSIFNSENPSRVPVHISIDENDNLVFDEALFESLDNMLVLANTYGVRIILPFIDHWSWWGGITDLARLRDKSRNDFWTDEQLKQDYKDIVSYVLNRQNSISGIAYKDDPAILAWETGNELRESTDEWTSEMAAFIKSIDSNHLVIDGKDTDISESSIVNTDIDIISNHYYGAETLERYKLDDEIVARRKPLMMGEFGLSNANEIKSVVDEVIESGLSGALVWSLRQHDANGGFLNHYEYGEHYAYHWPGFTSNDNYGEKEIVSYFWQKAAEISGNSPPVLAQPSYAPTLLPITSISDIRWQGVVDAQSYRVERSETPMVPDSWVELANNVELGASSTPIMVMRNLTDWKGVIHNNISTPVFFQDHTAELNKTYSYRVSAHNDSGSSDVSNIIEFTNVNGPDFGIFEDDIKNYGYSTSHSDAVGFETGDEFGRFVGDQDRLKRYSNTEEYIDYTFSADINSVEIDAYFWRTGDEANVAEFKILLSSDGINFDEASVKTIDHGNLVDDWEKVTYQGKDFATGYRYLRLQFPLSIADDKSFSPQLGKTRAGIGHIKLNFDAVVVTPSDDIVVIDNYQSYASSEDLNNRYTSVDNGDVATLTLINTDNDKHLELAYTLIDKGFLGTKLKFTNPVNWAASQGIQLDLTADSSQNRLVIQFTESSNEYWETTHILSGNTKEKVMLNWDSFDIPSWGGREDGVLDASSVREFSIFINKGSSSSPNVGKIIIDNIETF